MASQSDRTTSDVPGGLRVDVSSDGPGEVCVTLSGELDLATVPAFYRALAEIQQARLERVVIDLRLVEFMDSHALAMIIRAHRVAHESGYQVAIRRGNGQVRRLLDISGLDAELLVVD